MKRYFSDMLALWWKQDKGPKFENLMTSLRDIGEKRLAGELEKKYKGLYGINLSLAIKQNSFTILCP